MGINCTSLAAKGSKPWLEKEKRARPHSTGAVDDGEPLLVLWFYINTKAQKDPDHYAVASLQSKMKERWATVDIHLNGIVLLHSI